VAADTFGEKGDIGGLFAKTAAVSVRHTSEDEQTPLQNESPPAPLPKGFLGRKCTPTELVLGELVPGREIYTGAF
jgi:hypothetical protein